MSNMNICKGLCATLVLGWDCYPKNMNQFSGPLQEIQNRIFPPDVLFLDLKH